MVALNAQVESAVEDAPSAALGESHPGTLSVRTQLGFAYRAAGRLDEAITEYERVLADRERQYGASHPDTLESVNNLGAAYDLSGRTAAAVELLERAAAEYERTLGPDHPETRTVRANLAAAREQAAGGEIPRRSF